MKIGVFAYNFKHKKTQEGLINLFLNNHKVECILAANPVKLNFYQSKIRITPKNINYEHPKNIAKRLEIPYHIVIHNSETCKNLIKKYDLDIGIVLGSRILKKEIIDSFKIGVINLHPGLLPENRGLDNLKWAILKGIKQGVTSHFINEKIDHGKIITKREIEIYKDDSLVDIFLRIQDMEQKLMIESLKMLEENNLNLIKIENKEASEKAVPLELEKNLFSKFKRYKEKFGI